MWVYLSPSQGGYPVIEAEGAGSGWACVAEPLVSSPAGCSAVLRQERAGCVVVQCSNPSEHVWVLVLQSGDTVWGFSLLFSGALFSLGGNLNSSFPKGFPSLADGFGGALRRRRGECLWLLVEWKHGQTLPHLRFLHLSGAGGVSPALWCGCHWSCQLTANICLTKMSPQKVLKIRRWKKSKRREKKKSQPKIQTSFDLSPVV